MPQYDLGQERTSSSIISLKLLSPEDMYFLLLFSFFQWISVSTVNKPAAAFPMGEAQFLPEINMHLWFFFCNKVKAKQLKAMATLFHANNTGWIKQKDVSGNWMYQVKSSQLFAASLCLWKDTYAGISRMRALQTLAVCPVCPCFSISTAIPGRLLLQSVLHCGNGEIYFGSNFRPIISLTFKPFWQASPTPPFMMSLVIGSPSCTYSSFGCMLC